MSGYIGTKSVTLSTTSASVGGDSTVGGDLTVDTNTLYVDSTNNRVGVGTASPATALDVVGTATANELTANNGGSNTNIRLQNTNSGSSATDGFLIQHATNAHTYVWNYENADTIFGTNATEAMRISSGNLLVGKTAAGDTGAGVTIQGVGKISAVRDGGISAKFVRETSDGSIVEFVKDTTTVGSIASKDGDLAIGTGDTGFRFVDASDAIVPQNISTNAGRDNIIDLGNSGTRFDDIYATNGTIQTSDQNEKQQIASLTDAEITAAKAISKLFKTFKWNDSVAEKGDAARTHTGVIAQEVEAAMSDAGLNAGDYAFFISSDWTDEETGEERNRKGIRYPQLLSFIGAATEQRLASIEARLDALEGN
jgi:hypothetical protein